jgi:hypothetical protein
MAMEDDGQPEKGKVKFDEDDLLMLTWTVRRL